MALAMMGMVLAMAAGASGGVGGSAQERQLAQQKATDTRVYAKVVGDRLMLHALRASHGGAVAVEESKIEPAAAELRRGEGIDAGPETGAAWVALEALRADGVVREGETVVVFNTGGNKYR